MKGRIESISGTGGPTLAKSDENPQVPSMTVLEELPAGRRHNGYILSADTDRGYRLRTKNVLRDVGGLADLVHHCVSRANNPGRSRRPQNVKRVQIGVFGSKGPVFEQHRPGLADSFKLLHEWSEKGGMGASWFGELVDTRLAQGAPYSISAIHVANTTPKYRDDLQDSVRPIYADIDHD